MSGAGVDTGVVDEDIFSHIQPSKSTHSHTEPLLSGGFSMFSLVASWVVTDREPWFVNGLVLEQQPRRAIFPGADSGFDVVFFGFGKTTVD